MLSAGVAAKGTYALIFVKVGYVSLDKRGGPRYQVLILQTSYIRAV